MKRALSFILALTLALTLLPTFASAETTETMNWDEPVVFNLAAPTDTKSLALGENVSRTIGKKTTNNEGEVVVNSAEKKFYGENWAGWTTTSCKMIQAGRNDNTIVTYKNGREYVLFQVATTDYNKYDTYILALKIPASGIYDISSDIWNSASGGAIEASLNDVSIGGFDFFVTGAEGDTAAKKTREYSAGKGVAVAKTDTWTEGTVNIHENKFTLDFNWYDGLADTVVKTTNGIYNFKFTPSTIVENSVKVNTAAGYEVGDTFTPSVTLNIEGLTEAKTYSDLAQAGITLGLKNEVDGISVSGNVFTVNTAEKITFTPTVHVNGKTHEAAPVTINKQDTALTGAFIQEAAKKDITASYIAPTVAGTDFTGKVFNAKENTDGTFTLTAPEKNSADKPFLYWAKGMDTQKKIISFENVINDYVPAENGRNYLIAVYEGDITDNTNEYYNLNGQLIAKQANAPTDLPSIPGLGTAKEWKHCSGNIYVAEYADLERDNVTVTVNGGTGTQKNVPYGTLITCTADETKENFKCWKKEVNGVSEIVSIDDSYTFHAWETCTVEAVYADHYYTGSNMKILIDSFAIDTGVTGVMAEFIGLDNAVEKGIMFTDSEDKTTKIAMTTKDNQFTVVADEGTYVGYAILKGEGGYTLITDGSYEHN